jgi:hypothetical protein
MLLAWERLLSRQQPPQGRQQAPAAAPAAGGGASAGLPTRAATSGRAQPAAGPSRQRASRNACGAALNRAGDPRATNASTSCSCGRFVVLPLHCLWHASQCRVCVVHRRRHLMRSVVSFPAVCLVRVCCACVSCACVSPRPVLSSVMCCVPVVLCASRSVGPNERVPCVRPFCSQQCAQSQDNCHAVPRALSPRVW